MRTLERGREEAVVEIMDLGQEDFGRVAGWLSKPEINAWLTSEWRSHSVTPTLVAAVAMNRRNRLYLVTCAGEPCGVAALGQLDEVDRSAAVWCALGDLEFRGSGIMTQALGLLAREAFVNLGLRSLNASIVATNTASIRMVEKTGFRRVGSIRFGVVSEGEWVDRVVFDLIPEDIGLAVCTIDSRE